MRKTNCWGILWDERGSPLDRHQWSIHYPTVFSSVGSRTENASCINASSSTPSYTHIQNHATLSRKCSDHIPNTTSQINFRVYGVWNSGKSQFFGADNCATPPASYSWSGTPSPAVAAPPNWNLMTNTYCSNRYYTGIGNRAQYFFPGISIDDPTQVYEMQNLSGGWASPTSATNPQTDDNANCFKYKQCTQSNSNDKCISGRDQSYNNRKNLHSEIRSITTPYRSGLMQTCRDYFESIEEELTQLGSDVINDLPDETILQRATYNMYNCNEHSLPESERSGGTDQQGYTWNGNYGDIDFM